MTLHVPITEDLVSVLERVLGKSIVVDSRVQFGLEGTELRVTDARASSAVYEGYGRQGSWKEDRELDELFPFWRRDLWSK